MDINFSSGTKNRKAFAEPYNILTGALAGKKFKIVTVSIGEGGAPFSCLMMDKAGGAQPFRNQYDIALDGTEYVLAAGKGRGNYELTLLEGPIKSCRDARNKVKNMSLHKLYVSEMGSLKGRKITIVTGTSPTDTSDSWKFSGIIDQLVTEAQVLANGERFIINSIAATGMWE